MKIGMIFPDYGSQFVGMGKELYDNSRIIQEYFEEASNCLNINFVKLCFASSDSELARIMNAYAAIFLTSVSIASLLKEQHIIPQAVAGCGLGEYSAACFAGGLSFPDGLYFLNKYAQLYQDSLSEMAARSLRIIGISSAVLKKMCTQASDEQAQVSIAVSFGVNDHIVSGTVGAMRRVEEAISVSAKKPLSVQEVAIEAGLHNNLMDPVVAHLKLYLAKIDFKDITTPLVSSINGKSVTKAEAIKNNLVKQLHAPIMWNKVMDQLVAESDIIVEVGPGETLQKLLVTHNLNKKCISINKPSDINELLAIMGQEEGI